MLCPPYWLLATWAMIWGRDVAGCGEAVRALDQCLADHGAVLQHILQVYKIAVVHMLCKIVGVMEVDDSLLIRLYNIFRKKKSSREILADFASHIVTLYAVDRRILVGIFLHNLFVVALDQGQDPVVPRVCFPHQRATHAQNLRRLWQAVPHTCCSEPYSPFALT